MASPMLPGAGEAVPRPGGAPGDRDSSAMRRDALALDPRDASRDAMRHGWLELWYQPKIDPARARVRRRRRLCARAPSRARRRCRPTACSAAPPRGHAGADAARAHDRDARLVAVRERRPADPLLDQRADRRACQAAARLDRRRSTAPRRRTGRASFSRSARTRSCSDLMLAQQRSNAELRPHGICASRSTISAAPIRRSRMLKDLSVRRAEDRPQLRGRIATPTG